VVVALVRVAVGAAREVEVERAAAVGAAREAEARGRAMLEDGLLPRGILPEEIAPTMPPPSERRFLDRVVSGPAGL
jgi:hypothetical protein